MSERELLGIVEAAAEDEVIEQEEHELIHSVIELGDTVAREIMVPRPDMVTVPVTPAVTEALDLAIEHGYSRLPIIGESIDDVVGIAFAKDLMRAEREGRGFQPVGSLSRPPRFAPETKPVARLMREMQAEKFHMVVLVDEYGGTSGLVTLEDILEELVGEIVDEYDVEDADVEHLPTGELRLDGGLAIDEVNELLDIELPSEDWDTVGGFVFGTLGHVPTAGESVDFAGHRFTASKVDGRRISEVVVGTLAPALDQPTETRRGRGDRTSQTRRPRGRPPVTGFRSGFVALVGRPNVGKSTLLNTILAQKVTHRVRQAPDDPPPGARHPAPSRRPGGVRRHARHPQAGVGRSASG